MPVSSNPAPERIEKPSGESRASSTVKVNVFKYHIISYMFRLYLSNINLDIIIPHCPLLKGT